MGIDSDALFERCFNERIEVAIEHFLRVRRLHLGAQVFDATLVQNIGANLVTPAYIGFGVFEFLLLGHAFAHLEIVQATSQSLPRHIAVAVLTSTVLALNNDAGWQMGQANGRISFVDVLSTSARRSECVHTYIGGVDIYFDGVVNFWVNKHTGKTRVPTARGIKW